MVGLRVSAFRGLVRRSRRSWKRRQLFACTISRYRSAQSASYPSEPAGVRSGVLSALESLWLDLVLVFSRHGVVQVAQKLRSDACSPPAVMDRIGPAGKTLATALGVGGTVALAVNVQDLYQGYVDRNRMARRVIHSAFHAAKPEVEIPRKHVQARHHA